MSGLRGLVIIGAGAAGLGAANAARAFGVEPFIVEASNRIGGRAHTLEWNGHKLDLGAGWLHSAERNSLRAEAERLGVALDRSRPSWFEQYRDLGWSQDDQEAARRAFAALEERLRRDLPASDRASDALEPAGEWNAWLNALSGYINGAPLDEVSAIDWLAWDSGASAKNWRLREGYGGLLAKIGGGFDIRLQVPVTAISRLPDAVQLSTPSGVIQAERVVVTVSTAVLPTIRFDPPIAAVERLCSDLPLGQVEKLFLALDQPEEFPDDAHLTGNPHSAQTGSYMLRPMGMPVVEGFFGGLGARPIERMDLTAVAARAINELANLLGSSIRKRLSPIALSNWSQDPWIGGAYSHAVPGRADARDALLQAGDDRIAFAGEAVAGTDYSTAHGAYDSGRKVVQRLFARKNH